MPHFVVQVSGRILDRQCKFIGKDFSSSVKLDSDIYNPVYEHKEEIREAFFQPSATFLFKVWVFKFAIQLQAGILD